MPEAANEGGSTKAAKNLTDEQKELVRKTWKEAAKPEVQAGQKLFKKLFQISPDAVTYFSNVDMEDEGFKGHIGRVMNTLDQVIQNLDDLTLLIPNLEKLGKIHANMGIKKQQFAAVKQALLYTLSQELKDLFNDKCQEAWAITFDMLAEAMAQGMVA